MDVQDIREILMLAEESELAYKDDDGDYLAVWKDHIDLTEYLLKFAQLVEERTIAKFQK